MSITSQHTTSPVDEAKAMEQWLDDGGMPDRASEHTVEIVVNGYGSALSHELSFFITNVSVPGSPQGRLRGMDMDMWSMVTFLLSTAVSL